MASNRGPGAVTPEYRETSSQQWGNSSSVVRSGAVGGSWGNASTQQESYSRPSITVNSVPGASSGSGGAAVSDGTYERNLVLELCPPGGTKPVPPPDKLASFARACPTLNSDLICPVLLDCLEEGQPWVIRAKALCVMETCISSGTRLTDGSNPYRDFFHACQDEVVPLVSHPRAPIRDPAKRVLKLLGIAFDAPVVAPAQAPPQVEAPNLLDFGDDTISQPIASAPASHPPPPPSEAPPPPPSVASPAAASSMFGGMQIKAAPAQSTTKPVEASLLDFDAPAPAPSVSNDIFGDVTVKQVDSNAISSGVDMATPMFQQLTVNDTAEAIANGYDNDMKGVATSGSAFGFINASSDDAAAGSGTPSKPVFDPLKGGTPNSASQQKKTMQLSPEQMQAMAYQQMMMQQQFQQMQMAVAMQNQFHTPVMVPMHAPLGPNANMMPQAMNMRFHQAPNAASAGFSFVDAPKPAKKDDKKFDFVKDAMMSAGHKK